MRIVALALLAFAACDGPAPAENTPKIGLTSQDGLKEDFERENPKWKFFEGRWERKAGVLVQGGTADPWAVAVLEDRKYSDVDVSVRAKPISGKEDQAAGLIFRAADAKTYYLVRSNGLEDNFRLYTMKDGKRSQIASTQVDAPKAGAWHTLRVVAQGTRIQAYVDGKLLIDHEDGTFQDGYVGLWTKADSVTHFDDFEVKGKER